MTITASILSADLARLQEEVDSVASLVDALQIDVMDGHFVPNLSFGAPVIKNLQTDMPIDIHLMVSNPADRIAEFLAVGAAHITFHAEAVRSTVDRKRLMKVIRNGGATVGIAINPATSIDDIADIIADVDLALVMSVQPGFGGQEFQERSLEKVRALRAVHSRLKIQLDGGISARNIAACAAAGADNVVIGSALFSSPSSRKITIQSLRDILDSIRS